MKSGIRKMVEELLEVDSEVVDGFRYYSADRIDEILSRHKGAKPAEEGLREEIARWVKSVRNSLTGHADGEDLDDLEDIISEENKAFIPTPAKAEEPLAVDSTGCCPKCGLLLKDMSHESLAVLADRKNCYFTAVCHKGEWDIQIYSHEDGNDVPIEFCDGVKTYPEAEAKARTYLTSLPDK